MDTNSKKWTFEGVTSPNSTQIPDVLFDELLPVLSGAELKVLFYIARRTFGFKKAMDQISLSQMLNGIRRKEDGTALDHGTGLTKKTLLKALNNLTSHRVIFRERRRSLEKGDEATVYRLNLQDGAPQQSFSTPVGEKVHQGGRGKSTPGPWGKKYTTQDTVQQQTDLQDDDVVAALVDFGISRGQAARLRQSHSKRAILEKLEFTQYLVSTNSPLVGRNPQGFLVKAITDDYLPRAPRGFGASKERERDQRVRADEETKLQSAQREHVRQQLSFTKSQPKLKIPGAKLDTAQTWKLVLKKLRIEVTATNYQMWLKNSVLASCDAAGRATILVPNQFAADWLLGHLKASIERILTTVLNKPATVEFASRSVRVTPELTK